MKLENNAKKHWLTWLIAISLGFIIRSTVVAAVPDAKPNFVIILCDDLGYQDLGCFGSPLIKTPRIDQMAKEGMRFTSFYAQPVCGPSRAALMTGCYPLRVAKKENRVDLHFYVHTKEVMIPEILKPLGYATAAFGKWDMAGHTQTDFDPALMPNKQGFDYYFGTPSSNDQRVNLMRNETMIETNAAMETLTRRYTDEAISFITQHATQPFFVYLAHSMPHTKLAASKDFLGKSARGLYGDVVEEIDFNAGRLLDTLKSLGLDENTYIIFTSDNGPWWIKGKDGGCALPLRGAKTSTWDGGERVPCIIRAPGKIQAGTVCDTLTATMDLLPTFAKLSGGKLPTDRVIDGHDISGLMHNEKNATIPDTLFFYYQHTQLQAVRSERWKLILPRSAATSVVPPGWAAMIAPEDRIEIKQPMLIDLQADIGEKKDVAASHPQVVIELMKNVEWAREDIGDDNRIGKNARFFDPQPKRPDIGQNPLKKRKTK
jgi:arylsulfatase A-like enzyme